jgi:hypothetical protein
MNPIWLARVSTAAASVNPGPSEHVAGSAPLRSSRPVQINAGPPEQRVSDAVQVADQRPDPPPLDQLPPAARLPHAAGLAHQRRDLARAAHSHPGAEVPNFVGTDAGRKPV